MNSPNGSYQGWCSRGWFQLLSSWGGSPRPASGFFSAPFKALPLGWHSEHDFFCASWSTESVFPTVLQHSCGRVPLSSLPDVLEAWLLRAGPPGWGAPCGVQTSHSGRCLCNCDYPSFCELSTRACWRRQWHPTPVLLPGKSHGRRSLVGFSPWGCEESDLTEWLSFHLSLSCIGEGNGNPLQCSCWRIPETEGPGGLPSMGSHRVGHDWSDLAAAPELVDSDSVSSIPPTLLLWFLLYIFSHGKSFLLVFTLFSWIVAL